MVYLDFGKGRIGVKTKSHGVPSVCLSELSKTLEIGENCDHAGSEPVVELIFHNKKGLEVLINALLFCRTKFLTELPPEMRFAS
jgi:hypothetical protein